MNNDKDIEFNISDINWSNEKKHDFNHVDRTMTQDEWRAMYCSTFVPQNYQSDSGRIVNDIVKSFVNCNGHEHRIILCSGNKSHLASMVINHLTGRTTGLNKQKLNVIETDTLTTVTYGYTVLQMAIPRTLVNVLRGCYIDELHVPDDMIVTNQARCDLDMINVSMRKRSNYGIKLPQMPSHEWTTYKTGEETCKLKQKQTIGSLKLAEI